LPPDNGLIIHSADRNTADDRKRVLF